MADKIEELRARVEKEFLEAMDRYIAAQNESGVEMTRSSLIRQSVKVWMKENPEPPGRSQNQNRRKS